MKYSKAIYLFLGISMFMFGFLKFFDPFKGWYSVQISKSGLGAVSYGLGILGELVVGTIFLSLLIFRQGIRPKHHVLLSAFASVVVIAMMSTGTYVHLHPNVPADVLPLKIKPPFIPLIFLAAALLNLLSTWRNYKIS
ncbi:MAG TPA: hypothetical protein VD884_11345 [Ohtaekwangia sp.]|nr:hypothetical protein [Ohtaekwangia sp.]